MKNSLQPCIFCEIPTQGDASNVIRKFQHCYAIYDAFPVSPGHTLIIPYTCTEHWFTASEEIRLDILHALNWMKDFIDKQFLPQGYNIGMNCGPIAGQTVFHLHVHLIPRYKGDMDDPKGGIRGVIPNKQKY